MHSSKRQETRRVSLTPSRDWSTPSLHLPTSPTKTGQHRSTPSQEHYSSQQQPSLLGLSLRFCSPQTALENVWHVLEVLEGSPAESAGMWFFPSKGGCEAKGLEADPREPCDDDDDGHARAVH